MTGLVVPELAVALGIVLVLALDLVLPAQLRRGSSWLGLLALAVGLWACGTAPRGAFAAMLHVDALTQLARPALLFVTALVLLAGRGDKDSASDHGAWTASLLGLCLGGLVTAGSANLVTLWLGLELMSLTGYVLAGWRAGDRRAAEAGMKYVLFGGVASGVMLLGMSHLYGLTGHLEFGSIGVALGHEKPLAVVAALCLAGVGIAYKLAVVPFHFYAPDVYQGAPALSVAAVGVIPKLAAVAALVRAVPQTVPGNLVGPTGFGQALAAIAAASFLFASFTALVQRDAKRIVAFSAIGHSGVVLLAVACMPSEAAVAAAGFYLLAYAVANVGALVCLAVFEQDHGSTGFPALAGAMRRRPWLTAALCLFLFSLAGVPPLAGFLAKWGVLKEALALGLGNARQAHLAWAALALLISTAVSAWSYLLIVRAAVLAPAPEGEPAPARVTPGIFAVTVVCVIATFALGLWLDGFAAIARVLAS